MKTKVAAIQMCSSHLVKENLSAAMRWITEAAQHGAKLVVLPENFALMGMNDADKVNAKEFLNDGPIQSFLAEQAQKNQVWIVGGTIPLASQKADKVYSSCFVFNDKGQRVGRYDKIHLFDVSLSDTEFYRESDVTEPGYEASVISTPFGKLGVVVCYDLRFPNLLIQLFNQGAEIIAVPAAFTVKTGSAHWHLLTRCRAIDTFSYLVCAAQSGTHSSSRKTYGHSLIVDPWGTVLQEKTEGTGIIYADIDLNYLNQIRRTIPTKEHQRNVFR